MDPFKDALKRGHRPEYVETLRRMIEGATPGALAVCRAWHGETFGWPGHGGEDWVAGELRRAETAVRVLATLQERA